MLAESIRSLTDFGASLEVVSVDRINRDINSGLIPSSPDDYINNARQRQEQMQEEGASWQADAAAVSQATADFAASAPDGLEFGDATNCTGVGVTTSSGGTTYSVARTVGSDPAELRPNVFKNGDNKVGQITGPGRMNGDFGWSSDGNLIVGALASYTHNFVSSMLAYFSRPSLPYSSDEGWELPNLVLAETEDPDQFHPVGSFKYSLRPSAVKRFSVSIAAPQTSTVGIDLRDSNFNSISRIEEQEIQEGETNLVISSVGAGTEGFLNINPLDAPDGLTITSVSTYPSF